MTVGGNQKLSNNLNNEYVGDLVSMLAPDSPRASKLDTDAIIGTYEFN